MSTNATDAAAAAEEVAKAVFSNKGLSFGPYIMAFFLESLLFGVMVQQLLSWQAYSSNNERPLIKWIVYFVAVMGLIFTVFNVVFMMHLFAYGYGQYAPFESLDWLSWLPLLDSIISTAVQIFFVDRAYRLNGNNKLIIFGIGMLMVVSFGAALGTKIEASLLPAVADAAQIQTFVFIWLSTVMSIDVLIVVLIGIGLHKSRTGWSQTDALVKKLILLSCETQLPPTIVTLAFLIEYAINPPLTLGVFFEVIKNKVYIVGFLAVLNTRYNLRSEAENSDPTSRGRNTNTFALTTGRMQQATVNVHSETYVESYMMEPERLGHNRDPAFDIKEDVAEESEANSVNLDYNYNNSRTGLTEASKV